MSLIYYTRQESGKISFCFHFDRVSQLVTGTGSCNGEVGAGRRGFFSRNEIILIKFAIRKLKDVLSVTEDNAPIKANV